MSRDIVHNHGPSEGKGLACRERRIDGRLVGECLLSSPVSPGEGTGEAQTDAVRDALIRGADAAWYGGAATHDVNTLRLLATGEHPTHRLVSRAAWAAQQRDTELRDEVIRTAREAWNGYGGVNEFALMDILAVALRRLNDHEAARNGIPAAKGGD